MLMQEHFDRIATRSNTIFIPPYVPGLPYQTTSNQSRNLQHAVFLDSRHGPPPGYLFINRDDACFRRLRYPADARQRNLPIDSISIRSWMVSSVPTLRSIHEEECASLAPVVLLQ